MTDPACPFCNPAPDRVFHTSELVLALWDAFPVSPGHALIVPKRHIASWCDATPDERRELTETVERVRAIVEQAHQPQGFNVGWNDGRAAGQTVFHLHVHVIPRYEGDADDPRGGIRWILPNRARYW
jgi:diadenosine tetraphosphate (Ap4A) HIT family hydrolase